MTVIAQDQNNAPRLLKTDTSGQLVLGAGTNAIGTLAANSGVDIGDVDVKSIAAGDNNIGNVDVATLPALAAGTNTIGNINEARGKTMLYNQGAVSNGLATIRTVTAGKTYYLLALGLNVHSTNDGEVAQVYAGTSASMLMFIQTGVTATYNTRFEATYVVPFLHPLPIAAGTAIKVQSSAAGTSAYAWIIGWEE